MFCGFQTAFVLHHKSSSSSSIFCMLFLETELCIQYEASIHKKNKWSLMTYRLRFHAIFTSSARFARFCCRIFIYSAFTRLFHSADTLIFDILIGKFLINYKQTKPNHRHHKPLKDSCHWVVSEIKFAPRECGERKRIESFREKI